MHKVTTGQTITFSFLPISYRLLVNTLLSHIGGLFEQSGFRFLKV